MGLRELKKTRTRRLIAETAQRLFADRGFDRVTVAEVAREAQVAEATVFNYFPTKEDLFYSGLEAFGGQLIDAIRDRDPGEPVLVAVRRFVLEAGGLFDQIEAGDPGAVERARTLSRVIAESRALQAREQQAIANNADALAALLAAESGAPTPNLKDQVVANALMGAHRALIEHARRRILADDHIVAIASDLRAQGARAFALLEHGLGGYAPKPGA
jgi:AcrR family transcriptional regulator